MNKSQRQELENIASQLEEIRERLEEIAEVEMDKVNNAPENLSDSDRYTQMEEYADTLNDASSDLDDIIDSIRNDVIDN
jgi:Asp-tRNA(Asn)/Glu-tRNA(Gln) amidotransferase C subunit